MELFRAGCVLCGRPGPALCAACVRGLVPPPSTRVRGVGPVPALFAYDGVGARVVQALKYRDGRRLVAPLADAIVRHDVVRTSADAGIGVVSWVPTTAARRRDRGFDQAELLARAVARRLRRPCRPVLHRAPGPSQTGRNRAERAHGVRFRPLGAGGLPVLLLDDVCTTGATVRAAVEALETRPIGPVAVAVVARTP